jgi:glycosyltransferase involved in cell wall biosynthesis
MKKKIWIMNHYATNSYYNSGGRHYWFAQNLLKRGYNPTIFCANTRHNSKDSLEIGKYEKYTTRLLDGIPYVFVKTTASFGNGLDRIKNMLLFYFNLFKAAEKYKKTNGKPDVILASSVHPLTMVAGIKIAKKLNVPCICEIRDLWPEAIFSFKKLKESSILGKLLIKGEYWIYKNADALIFTKEGDTDYIKEKKWDKEQGGKIDIRKCHYINNGLDLDAFEKSITEFVLDDKDLDKDKFNIVYAGAIRPVNDVGKILDAALHLKDENEIQFLIYGDGNQKELLEQRLINESLSNVKMKGSVDKKFIPHILSKSSVNLLNYSQNQYNWSRGNSSNKLFEYMASGKPVISTVKMGYSIIDRYNCGIELDNSTPEELSKAILEIKRMSKEKYKAIGFNARQGAKDFDFAILTDKLDRVINSVIGREMND